MTSPARGARAVLLGGATVLLALALAAASSWASHGRYGELRAFALWSVPLGVGIMRFAARPRFVRASRMRRALGAAGFGVGLGLAMTLGGYLLIGGFMLTWDFPVFYCWSIAAAFGALAALASDRSITFAHAGAALLLALSPLLGLGWYSLRPTPGILITLAGDDDHAAYSYALDSLLSQPHPSGTGRVLRWPHRRWEFLPMERGATSLLIALEDADDRAAIRAALAGYVPVRSIRDTLLK